MAKEKSKPEIIQQLQTERRRLEANLSRLAPQDYLKPGVVGAWSVKDILAHLAHWEARLPVWIEAARRGDPVETPAPGLTWGQLDLFNQQIYTEHRDQSLEEVLAYFQETHRRFMHMVESMPEDEMLTRARYAFIGQGAVANWLSAYANHDLWAKTHIRRWLAARQQGKTR